MHPKSITDLSVTRDELVILRTASDWFRNTVEAMFRVLDPVLEIAMGQAIARAEEAKAQWQECESRIVLLERRQQELRELRSHSDIIGSDAVTRIFDGVVAMGIEQSATDTNQEAEFRARVVEWLQKTRAEGGGAEILFE